MKKFLALLVLAIIVAIFVLPLVQCATSVGL